MLNIYMNRKSEAAEDESTLLSFTTHQLYKDSDAEDVRGHQRQHQCASLPFFFLPPLLNQG